ncbi:hypothetical protein B0H13DRAFT_1924807 [Mycena leptocephala]|nr:hypothetical protein B0H13DRAFT_1924807 [Mycena leptocephala]
MAHWAHGRRHSDDGHAAAAVSCVRGMTAGDVALRESQGRLSGLPGSGRSGRSGRLAWQKRRRRTCKGIERRRREARDYRTSGHYPGLGYVLERREVSIDTRMSGQKKMLRATDVRVGRAVCERDEGNDVGYGGCETVASGLKSGSASERVQSARTYGFRNGSNEGRDVRAGARAGGVERGGGERVRGRDMRSRTRPSEPFCLMRGDEDVDELCGEFERCC